MKTQSPNHEQPIRPNVSRPAFALLWLLISVAFGMIFYYVSFYRPDAKLLKQQQKAPDTYPWVEEWRLRDSVMEKPKNVILHKPSDQLPVLTETIAINAFVQQDGNKRGNLSLLISPDGNVSGSWNGEYLLDSGTRFEVMVGSFEGNTDPTRLLEDSNGPDPARLYFIAKGDLLMIETLSDNRVRKFIGWIYLVGYINPDLSVSGKLHITSDKETQHIFQWSGKPSPRQRRFSL